MNFDFDDDQKIIQSEIRRFLEDRAPIERVREVLDGKLPFQEALWRELGAMGFTGAAIPEAEGGSGLGYLELCLIAEELGRSLAAVPFASTVYLAAELIKAEGDEAQRARWLPRIATATTIGCLAVTEHSGRSDFSRLQCRYQDGTLTGVKHPVSDGDIADFAIVLAADGDADGKPSLFLVELTGAGVARVSLTSIDPTRAIARISFADAGAVRLGPAGDGLRILDEVYDKAAVLMAFEQIGGADRSLWMARDYSLERYAFGQPIGSFQAMKHLMADMYASATLARSNAYYGAWALSTGAAELPLAAAYARVSATRAYQFCASNCIQIHGGMGFTWEFDCHLHYRRANFLSLQCGTPTEWDRRLIARLDRVGGPAGAIGSGEPSHLGSKEAA
ncbi:acyl-CoA dehydrogenase family protein [Sphingobium sp.]|uniref:acyl-CoA dehydrogenase family protein n=1 Tax=Sphingobium sp. TaxID=1912891 RepID=UPI003BB4C555